jgi:hypothetical protein
LPASRRCASLLPPPAPSPTRLSLLLSAAAQVPSLLHPTWHVAGTCVARAHACVRYGAWAGCGAHSVRPSTALAAAAPAAIAALTCPCQAQNAKNSSERGRARSTRGAGGRQTLPTPWPIGAALAQAPDRSHRRPGAVSHCRTVDFLKRHDVEAPIRRDDQDQEDGDDAPTRGYPVVPVAPRSALPIARASDGHQRRRKGDRHFES